MRLDHVVVDTPKAATEEPLEVSLPLRDEVGRAHDQTTVHDSEPLGLAGVEARHDRLPGAGFVAEEESQLGLREHALVHGLMLVGVRRQLRRDHRSAAGVGRGRPHPLRPHAGEHVYRPRLAVGREALHLRRLRCVERNLPEHPRFAVLDGQHQPRPRVVQHANLDVPLLARKPDEITFRERHCAVADLPHFVQLHACVSHATAEDAQVSRRVLVVQYSKSVTASKARPPICRPSYA